MVTTFKYSVLRRLFVIIIMSPLIIVSFGIIRDAFPMENYLYSFLCMVVATSFGFFAIHIVNEFWIKIIIDNEGISVKKLFNSYSSEWEDIVEYGREQPFGYGGGNWRYYIKISRYGDRKIIIYRGKLKEFKRLNAHFLLKLETPRLNNISAGMIS